MIPFSIIVAVDKNLGIGKNGLLPWHLPSDLKYFKEITTRAASSGKINAVIMGRKTWESIPLQFRPLPQRLNIVVSRQTNLLIPYGGMHALSFQAALDLAENQKADIGEIFVIGGAQIFKEAVNHPACQTIYLTRVEMEFTCDTFFPDVLKRFTQVSCKGPVVDQGIDVAFLQYIRNT